MFLNMYDKTNSFLLIVEVMCEIRPLTYAYALYYPSVCRNLEFHSRFARGPSSHLGRGCNALNPRFRN